MKKERPIKLCSACLLGFYCKYNSKIKANRKVLALAKKEILIPVCPEQMGGQPTPRPSAEIKGGSGKDVLVGKAKVVEIDGTDVSKLFLVGARQTLRVAKLFKVRQAILKQRSPSCGSGQTYDGSFSGRIIKGDGVTTALLKRHGIKVISEEEL